MYTIHQGLSATYLSEQVHTVAAQKLSCRLCTTITLPMPYLDYLQSLVNELFIR